MLALLAAASATTDLRITFTKVASPKAGAIGLSGIRLLDADGERRAPRSRHLEESHLRRRPPPLPSGRRGRSIPHW